MQGLELLRESISGEFVYWLHRNFEQGECLVLYRGRPCEHGEWQVGCDRGDDGVACQGCEIRQQGVEAVHRQPVAGQAGDLLGDSPR